MGIVFGLFVVVILFIAWRNRKKEVRQWVKEERYDESGGWIDKRAGERGTFGSLDEAREQERLAVNRQGQAAELSQRIRDFVFEQVPGFHTLRDEQIKQFLAFARAEAAQIRARMEERSQGVAPGPVAQTPGGHPKTPALKKILLDFAYQNYPPLLDLEIGQLRLFDEEAATWATGILAKVPG